jgi:hypothetical protein
MLLSHFLLKGFWLFIPIENVPHYKNEVIKLDDLTTDTTLVGYIFGGIMSNAPNIFNTNTGAESSASRQIFKVFVIKNAVTGIPQLNSQSIGTLKMQVFPNPNKGVFTVNFNMAKMAEVKVSLYNMEGKIMDQQIITNPTIGPNQYRYELKNGEKEGTYFLTIETPYEKATQKIIIKH